MTMSALQPDQAVGSASWDLGLIYELIAELLLNPEIRDPLWVEGALERLPNSAVRELLERFKANPAAHNIDEYTQTLELTPPCPLYLGAHLYEEPNSCRGAGACDRNQYMIELGAIYEHFGLGVDARELADFLPVMIDFLAASAKRTERDGIGLRRRFVEHYLAPGLPALRASMRKYESVYELLVEALEIAIDEDLERMAEDPIWLPPEILETIPVTIQGPGQSAGAQPAQSPSMMAGERP
ncbi:MAG: hypothetical protein GVY22_05075 [Gammaproteobacteria bacterium]|nr:hypothetical protein [Gammaproteobacteria bacterium]